MRTRIVVAAFVCALVAAPAPGSGQPTSRRSRLNAGARFALDLWQRGRPLPRPGRTSMVAPQTVNVAMRFTVAPSEERLDELEQLGAHFYRVDGRRLRIGRIVPAALPFELLEMMSEAPDIDRVEVRMPSPAAMPVENAPTFVEVPPVYPNLDAYGLPVTGKGVTVGIIDSWVDHLHPWFFRPDGQPTAWLDADSNGTLTPGVDGLDLNHDGTLAPKEVLRVQKGSVYWDEGMGPQSDNTSPGYLPELDWLYLDTNGNGKRDAGWEEGFKETTPGYGEPIFVADDVNGNGILEHDERLVQLGTSKLTSILLLNYELQLYSRGDNLIQYPRMLDTSSHATMTLGVLAGGAYPYQPYHGVAPDANLMLLDRYQSSQFQYGGYGEPYIAASLAMVQRGADVLMHEYGSPFLEFGDGSSLLEEAIDQIAEENGVVSCTAAHNYAGYDMHAMAEIPAKGMLEIPMSVNIYDDYYPTNGVYFAVRHRVPGVVLGLGLKGPQVDAVGLEESGTVSQGDVEIWSYGTEESERGTTMVNLVLAPQNWDNPLPGKMWTAVLTNPSDEVVKVDIFAADQTGYFYTGSIKQYTTKAGTMAHPSTADSAITAGAYIANVDTWYGELEVGDLTYYSGRGPRIDGARGMDVAGPSDLLAAWYSPEFPGYPGLSYASGTSGSLPQVTGVVALLLQAEPDLSAAEVKERILAGAIDDSFTGAVPNPTWGTGKLSAYRTLYGEEPPANEAPVAILNGPSEVYLQQPFVLDASDSADDGGVENLQARWDLGYNGSFDIPWRDDLTLPIDAAYDPGLFIALVEVKDQWGWTDRAVVEVTVLDEVYVPPVVEPPTGTDEDVTVKSEVSTADLPSPEDVSESDAGTTLRSRSGGCSQTDHPGAAALLLLLLIQLLVLHRIRCKQPEQVSH